MAAAAKAVTPAIAVVNERAISGIVPSSNNAGPYTNMNGTMKPALAKSAADSAVRTGGEPAIPAAANAASDTGGVTLEIHPK